MFFKNFSYDHQHKQEFDVLIEKWEPSSDVWPFKYGKYVLPGFGSLTAFWTTMYLRRMARMRSVARFSTAAIPLYGTVFCGLIHTVLVEYPLVAGRERCSICSGVRSGVIQGIFGSIIPTIMSGITVAYAAGASNMYAFRDNMFTDWSAMKANGSIILNMFKKRGRERFVVAFFITNVLLGHLVAHFQFESLYKVASKLHTKTDSFIVKPDEWDPLGGIKRT